MHRTLIVQFFGIMCQYRPENGSYPFSSKGSGAKIAPGENNVRRLQTFFTVVLEPNVHTFSVLSETQVSALF